MQEFSCFLTESLILRLCIQTLKSVAFDECSKFARMFQCQRDWNRKYSVDQHKLSYNQKLSRKKNEWNCEIEKYLEKFSLPMMLIQFYCKYLSVCLFCFARARVCVYRIRWRMERRARANKLLFSAQAMWNKWLCIWIILLEETIPAITLYLSAWDLNHCFRNRNALFSQLLSSFLHPKTT